MTGVNSGIPGDFTTVSAAKIRSKEWPNSSHSILFEASSFLYFSEINAASETKTFIPLILAKTAAPTPLSPAPNTIIFCCLAFTILILA